MAAVLVKLRCLEVASFECRVSAARARVKALDRTSLWNSTLTTPYASEAVEGPATERRAGRS